MPRSPTLRPAVTLTVGVALLAACTGPQPAIPATTTTPSPPVAAAAAPGRELPPRETLINAFRQLEAAPDYSFRSSAEMTLRLGEAPPFVRTETEVGQVRQGGIALISSTSTINGGTRTSRLVRYRDRMVAESGAGAWHARPLRSPADRDGEAQPDTQLARMLQQAGQLQNVHREGDVIVGEITGPVPGPADAEPPTVAVREIRYWLQGGLVVKQEIRVHVVRRMPNGPERIRDQRITTEYYDVGTTTFTLPPGARAALGLI